MDRHLCLDLKTAAQHRKCLHELIAESPVAGHDVPDRGVEQTIDRRTHEVVAEIVKAALVFSFIRAGEAVADYHVGVAVKDEVHHGIGSLCRVCVVRVYHNVGFGVDFPEHSPDHIALSLTVLVTDDGAGGGSEGDRVIRRVVIVDIDNCIREGGFEVGDYFCDCGCFVEAGD